MPEIRSLLDSPGLWVLALLVVLVASGVGTWWLVRGERRRPTSHSRSAEFLEGVRRWRELSAAEQEAHDNAVLDAAEAAEVVASRAEPSVVQLAELVVEAEHARTIAER